MVPGVMVSGTLAQTFSLLVHELATNALKYGAFSNATGREAALPTGPSGPARLTFAPAGLTYEVEIPMSAISPGD